MRAMTFLFLILPLDFFAPCAARRCAQHYLEKRYHPPATRQNSE